MEKEENLDKNIKKSDPSENENVVEEQTEENDTESNVKEKKDISPEEKILELEKLGNIGDTQRNISLNPKDLIKKNNN